MGVGGDVSVQVFSRQAWSFITDLVYEIPKKNKARAPWKKKKKKQETHCCKTEFLARTHLLVFVSGLA